MWAVGWQGAQDVKRSERPRPVSAGAAARNHARSYDMKPLTLNPSSIGHLTQAAEESGKSLFWGRKPFKNRPRKQELRVPKTNYALHARLSTAVKRAKSHDQSHETRS